MKKARGEDMIGSLWYAYKEMAEALWRKLAAACAAAGDGSGAHLRQAGKGWVVELGGGGIPAPGTSVSRRSGVTVRYTPGDSAMRQRGAGWAAPRWLWPDGGAA